MTNRNLRQLAFTPTLGRHLLRGPRRITGDVLKMTPEEHKRAFLGYVAALIADFERYVDGKYVDLLRDVVAYRIAAMWLDDAELQELVKGFVNLVQPMLDNPQGRDASVASFGPSSSRGRIRRYLIRFHLGLCSSKVWKVQASMNLPLLPSLPPVRSPWRPGERGRWLYMLRRAGSL